MLYAPRKDELVDRPTPQSESIPAPAGWSVRAKLLGKLLGKLLWRWRYRLPLLLLAAAAAWFIGIPAVLGPVVAVDAVVRADFTQSVVASGHVEAPFRVNIGSQITGIVADVVVSEGQSVKAGETLIMLDDREARAAVVQAQSAVAQSEARLRQIREVLLPQAQQALEQARATLVNAQNSYDRTAKLAESGIATRAALDDVTRALDVARAQFRSTQLQVYTNSPGGSDYVVAETLLNQARAALDTAQSRLGYTVITAPRDGILISRNVERGYVVQPAMVLMKLSPVGITQLIVQIDEKNLGLLAVGQKALASADAFPKATFPAEVVYINPGVDLQRASVEVKLRVENPPDYLRQDMTVSVDIAVAERAQAVIAPAASLRGLTGDRPWVMKVSDGYASRQPVRIGLVSAGKAEILEGLKEGDLVLAASSTVKIGARVRARVARSAPGAP